MGNVSTFRNLHTTTFHKRQVCRYVQSGLLIHK